ncbi:hypothetical protein PybrP1_003932 [[Pythium] brassicae (nom. inval.)]|nr:hypothetical protein PybrP1_003932 [[Pythium] brassicae (nom. inval.)]
MAVNFCVECGAPRASGSACPLCGTAYVTAPLPAATAVARSTAPPRTHVTRSASASHRPPDTTSAPFTRSNIDSDGSSVDSYDHGVNGSDPSQANLRRTQSTPVHSAPAGYAAVVATGAGAASSTPPRQTRGILAGRYANHPSCDICRIGFDVTKRRHHRRCGYFICSSCSPLRLLIPWGEQLEGARGYDKSVPQRVCIHCAPELHPQQEALVALHARANAWNAHQTKGRLHLPYTSSLEKECQHAADIVGNFFRDDNAAASDRAIPVAILEKAHGLAILTIVKAGFMIVGKLGTGLVLSKLADGSWSAPSAIGTVGLGGGFEIGGEIVEVVIVLGSPGAVEVFHKPQVNLGAGLDIAVGPYGRSATAAAALSTNRLHANYSYSHSRGLYAGISLQGSVIAARTDLNRHFYGRDLEPKELLDGSVEPPLAAQPLYDALRDAMRHVEEHKEVLAERAAIMGACRICQCPAFEAHTLQVWNKKCKTCDHIH